uniref:RNA-dependent RNA polymerase n=1 Tax=Phytophthora palustris narna-like virus 1 TaxID=2976291 RepID=A0A9E8Z4N3_9VIRU|nr:RNA-dependent RNA polymerase [Phytophthora palustris narna-like virus 1]
MHWQGQGARILSERPQDTILNSIKQVECLIDNLLLYDRTLFDRNNPDHKVIGRRVRVTLKLCTYSVDDQVAQWKDLVNHLVTLRSKAIVEKSVNLRFNAYRWLLKTATIRDLVRNPRKDRSERMAHLISTRNLAPGGKRARLKAVARFKELTSSAFITNETALQKLGIVTQRVTNICSTIRGTNLLSGGHCSLNNSGTLDVPVRLGGRAADAIIDIRRFLNEKPENGYTREYPWGTRYYPTGRPRWQAWGRSEEPSDTEFLAVIQRETLGQRENLAGIGPSTGSMVYTVAYEMYDREKEKGIPLPIRQATVPEPGGKCRIVTTGHWWLAVVQQPLCHMVAFHPSAYSVMLRADQAWQALKVLERLSISSLEDIDDVYVLSSDLKEATDAMPHDVARMMLKSLLTALGSSARKWLWILDLIGPRTVFAEDGSVFTLQRGVMMGEPLSKVCLILLNLVVEDMAFLEYLGKSLHVTRAPRVPWRAYHVGGDDHLAVGPIGYLKKITANHRSYGSVISPEKHRISRFMVVYTEKVLHFDGRTINMPVDQIDDNIIDSVFVDSVKVRLLSPYTKAIETISDRNVAIGKVKGISRSLQYLKSSSMKRLVIDRALYRFRDFIKGPHHRTIRSVESLPVELGGLGIALDTRYLANLPPIFNRGLRSICTADPVGYQVRLLLGTIFSNDTSRGVSTHDFIAKWPVVGSVRDWFQIIDPQNHLTFRAKLQRLKQRGIVSLNDLPQLIERSYVFRRLLEQVDIRPGYRTEPVAKRIAKAWTSLENLQGRLHPDGSPLSERELAAAQKLAKQVLLINLNEGMILPIYNRDSDGDLTELRFRRTDILDVVRFGQPSMTVDIRHLTRC